MPSSAVPPWVKVPRIGNGWSMYVVREVRVVRRLWRVKGQMDVGDVPVLRF